MTAVMAFLVSCNGVRDGGCVFQTQEIVESDNITHARRLLKAEGWDYQRHTFAINNVRHIDVCRLCLLGK
jgi:hypothetical protein